MAVREVLESRNYTRDFLGKRQGTRVFQVDATTEAAALGHIDIPQENSEYPGDPGCKCDQRVATPIPGFGVYNVNLSYSSDRSGGMPQVKDKLAAGYYKLFEGFEDADLTYPAFGKKTERVSSGGNSVDLLVYEAKKITAKITRAYMGVEVVTPFLDINQMTYIAGQVGKLHELQPGSKWLFMGATMQEYERDTTKQLVRYKWTFDPGYPSPADNGPIPDGMLAPAIPRLPYTEYVPVWVAGDPDAPPEFKLFYPCAIDDLQGWVNLPGIPLL